MLQSFTVNSAGLKTDLKSDLATWYSS